MSDHPTTKSPRGIAALFVWWQTFLRRPLNGWSRVILVIAAICMVAALLFPVWRINLVAPQYRDGLDLYIYAWKLEAGNGGQDLVEINILNHYIGMKALEEADFLEMQWMPFVFGIFIILMLRVAVIGRMIPVIDLIVMMGYFGLFSLGTFAYRLYTYGHHLDPMAPVRMEPFMPYLIGVNKIANFVQSSFPAFGAYLLGTSWLLIILAAIVSHREKPM